MTRDSAAARALRVLAYQAIILVIAFLLSPDVVKAIADSYPQVGALLLAGAPILSALYNVLRSDVKNV